MARTPSRPARWQKAGTDALEVAREMEALASKLEDSMSELRDVQQEYSDWRDNLPDNLQGSALADKLNEVADLELEWSTSDSVEDAISNLETAEQVELPRGFGRD